jgi:Ricin-type beta-trefoil lectin domain
LSKIRLFLASLCVLYGVTAVNAQTRTYFKTNEYVGVWWNDSRGGDFLVSPSQNFHAYINYGGRFTIYKGPSPWQSYGVLWQVPANKCCVTYLVMQGDGNLVNYLGSDPAHSQGWLWGSQVTSSGGQFYATLQDDGNLCVYKGTGPSDSRGFVWCNMGTAAVTWASGRGYILQNGTGSCLTYGGNPMPAWGMAVSMQGTHTSRRWTFSKDSTLRWSSNNACLQRDPSNGATGLVACNGSADQKGWYYQASDRTIRNSSYPQGCLTAGSSPLYQGSSPVANYRQTPCAGGPASTWTLEGDHPN